MGSALERQVTRSGVSGLLSDCLTVKVELPSLPSIWFLDCRLQGEVGCFLRCFRLCIPVCLESWPLAPEVMGSLHKQNQMVNSHQLEMQLRMSQSLSLSWDCDSHVLWYANCPWTMQLSLSLDRAYSVLVWDKQCKPYVYIFLLLRIKLISQLTSN